MRYCRNSDGHRLLTLSEADAFSAQHTNQTCKGTSFGRSAKYSGLVEAVQVEGEIECTCANLSTTLTTPFYLSLVSCFLYICSRRQEGGKGRSFG
ncbi:hypothetical protein ACFX1X_012678 [Malus domestica]